MVMESIKEDQKKRKETLRRGKQKKIRFLKCKRNIYGTSEQQDNLNNNSNNHDNGYGWKQQRNYLRNEYSQERSHGQSHYGIRLDDHSERSHWNDRLKDTQSRKWSNKEGNSHQSRRNNDDEDRNQRNRNQPNRAPYDQDSTLSRPDSNISLGKRRSSNRLLNSKNSNQPRLWSTLLQPNVNRVTNEQGNDTEAMQQRINQLEKQLVRQSRNNEGNTTSKNLESTSRNGGGKMNNTLSTSRPKDTQAYNQNGPVNPM